MATDTRTPDELRQRLHRIKPWDEGPSIGDRVVQEGLRQLSLPGQYARGLLSGRPGQKATGEEMLKSWGIQHPHPVGSFAWDVATDPLTYAGPGLMKAGGKAADLLRAGGAVLGEGASANPLANAMRKFAGEESGKLDWSVFGHSLPNRGAREAFHQLGPDEFFKQRVGYGVEHTPAHQLDVLGERVGVPVHWGSEDVYRGVLGDLSDPSTYPMAAYYQKAPGMYHKSVVIPTTRQQWWDPELMGTTMQAYGTPYPYEPNIMSPWLSTTDPRHTAVHELVHALHHRATGPRFATLTGGEVDPLLADFMKQRLSKYSTTNPVEAVAETGTRGILSPLGTKRSIPPDIRKAYKADWEGPSITRMKKELGL